MLFIAYGLLIFSVFNILLLLLNDFQARNNFIKFLRSENDIQTLQKIGAADSDGQECYKRVLYFSVQEFIIARYEETGKKEYLDFHNNMYHSTRIILFVLLIIVGLIMKELAS